MSVMLFYVSNYLMISYNKTPYVYLINTPSVSENYEKRNSKTKKVNSKRFFLIGSACYYKNYHG